MSSLISRHCWNHQANPSSAFLPARALLELQNPRGNWFDLQELLQQLSFGSAAPWHCPALALPRRCCHLPPRTQPSEPPTIPKSWKKTSNTQRGGRTDRQSLDSSSCRSHAGPGERQRRVGTTRGRTGTGQGQEPRHGAGTWGPHRGRSVLLCRVFLEVPSSLGRARCRLDMAAVFLRSMTA